MEPPRRSAGTIVTATVLSVVAVALLLAPILTTGFCADSSQPGESYCVSTQRSVVGIETSVWLWAAVTIAIVVVGTVLAVRARRRDRDAPPS